MPTCDICDDEVVEVYKCRICGLNFCDICGLTSQMLCENCIEEDKDEEY